MNFEFSDTDLVRTLDHSEHALDTLRKVLVFFALLVAVGLVLEYKTPLKLIFAGLVRLISLKSNSVDRCTLRKMCWHFVGAVLVTIGVGGELFVEYFQYNAEGNFTRAAAAMRDSLKRETTRANEHANALDVANKRLGIDLATANLALIRRQAELEREQEQNARGLELERQKTARAQKEAADAELALRDQIEVVGKQGRPRELDSETFVNFLKGKPKATVEILYQPFDPEAWELGQQIRRWLGPGARGDGLGWDVSEPRPIREDDTIPGWPDLNSPNVPLATRSGAWHNLGLVARTGTPEPIMPPENEKTPVYALSWALLKSGAGGGSVFFDPRLPFGIIRIVVGPKMN